MSWGYLLLQDHYLRNVDDDEGDGKNHGRCLNLLTEIAVDLETELQVMRIRDLLFGHEPLGQSPGQSLLALIPHISGCHVQAKGIAGHVVKGHGLQDSTAALAHHHSV